MRAQVVIGAVLDAHCCTLAVSWEVKGLRVVPSHGGASLHGAEPEASFGKGLPQQALIGAAIEHLVGLQDGITIVNEPGLAGARP